MSDIKSENDEIKQEKNKIIKQVPTIITKDDIYEIIPLSLLVIIAKNFKLNLEDIHGINHWLRVLTNGLILADSEKVSYNIPIVFSFTHDMLRFTDYDTDTEHGARAAEALEYMKHKLKLNAEELEICKEACKRHSDGLVTDEKEIGVCWDADRLDLMRVGIYPDEKYLSTRTGKNSGLIIQTNKYALRNDVNDLCSTIKKDIYSELSRKSGFHSILDFLRR